MTMKNELINSAVLDGVNDDTLKTQLLVKSQEKKFLNHYELLESALAMEKLLSRTNLARACSLRKQTQTNNYAQRSHQDDFHLSGAQIKTILEILITVRNLVLQVILIIMKTICNLEITKQTTIAETDTLSRNNFQQ